MTTPASFQLIEKDWCQLLAQSAQEDRSSLKIICPFIQKRSLHHLLQNKYPDEIQIITRLNLNEMLLGVNDLEALRHMLQLGAQIRGIKHLHAKLYLFGSSQAYVTSANLTWAALTRNHEFGMCLRDPAAIESCQQYFERLWEGAETDVTSSLLNAMEKEMLACRKEFGDEDIIPKLGDFGKEIGLPPPPENEAILIAQRGIDPNSIPVRVQAFVKFFGKSDYRADGDMSVLEQIDESGCNFACTYPKDWSVKRVADGATMYLGRMMKNGDIRIFGRATALKHDPATDHASEEDITIPAHEWKRRWRTYVRVRDAELLAGTMADGVSLRELMDSFEWESFGSTAENMLEGAGKNLNPRVAYSQQPDVQLTDKGDAWLREKLETALAKHGKISQTEIEQFYPNNRTPVVRPRMWDRGGRQVPGLGA